MILEKLKYKVCRSIPFLEFYGTLDYPSCNYELYRAIRYRSCKKEPDTVRWIEGFGADEIVYDIGACVGAYSLIMSHYAKSVYAFEPSIFNFDLLVKNLKRNRANKHIADNLFVFNIALGEKTELATLRYGSLDDGAAFNTIDDGTGQATFASKVLCISIDDLIDKFGFPVPQHIKLDVDGLEFEILRGASKTLCRKEVKSVLVEINDASEQVIGLMQGCGFTLQSKAKTLTSTPYLIFSR